MIVHTHDELGHEIRQGSSTWWALRCGKPTCSELHKVMTPAKREYSKAAHAYIADLLAEQMLGEPLEWGSTEWTERGTELEAKARAWYELERGVEVQRVAFITNDEGDEGGSPDGLVGEDGILEIKCYGASHHMRCLLGLEDIASPLQVQGLLRLTGRKWVDVLAWNPKLPPKLARVWRDDAFIDALDSCMQKFKDDMAKVKARLAVVSAGGGVEDDGLLAQLAASVRQRFESHPDALTPDELAEFQAQLPEAQARGIFDEKDVRAILADVKAGRWEDVRNMRAVMQRGLSLAVVS